MRIGRCSKESKGKKEPYFLVAYNQKLLDIIISLTLCSLNWSAFVKTTEPSEFLTLTAFSTIFALGEKCSKNNENIMCNLLIGLFYLKKS